MSLTLAELRDQLIYESAMKLTRQRRARGDWMIPITEPANRQNVVHAVVTDPDALYREALKAMQVQEAQPDQPQANKSRWSDLTPEQRAQRMAAAHAARRTQTQRSKQNDRQPTN